jgi:hypothetical protein
VPPSACVCWAAHPFAQFCPFVVNGRVVCLDLPLIILPAGCSRVASSAHSTHGSGRLRRFFCNKRAYSRAAIAQKRVLCNHIPRPCGCWASYASSSPASTVPLVTAGLQKRPSRFEVGRPPLLAKAILTSHRPCPNFLGSAARSSPGNASTPCHVGWALIPAISLVRPLHTNTAKPLLHRQYHPSRTELSSCICYYSWDGDTSARVALA